MRNQIDPFISLFSFPSHLSGKSELLLIPLLFLLLLCLPLLAACAVSPAGSAANGGFSANPAVQATIAARQAQGAAATYDAVAVSGGTEDPQRRRARHLRKRPFEWSLALAALRSR